MGALQDYHEYDAIGLAQLIRDRQVSPLELVEEAIERIEIYNAEINAVVLKLYDRAREEASSQLPPGPFQGVPFLQKDMYDPVAGVPMSCGTRLLADVIQPSDSEMTKRYRRSGLVLMGKTNLPELSLTSSTESALHGATRNPWDPERSAGGSSGGSAAAVAVRVVPMASGEDGGGSIRMPASCCGVFGLKPTRGRTPTGPDVGDVWRGFCQGHVITRSVRDSAAMLDELSGPEPGAPYITASPEIPYLEEVTTEPGRLRIAFTPDPLLGHRVHPECIEGLEHTAGLLQDLGHEVEPAKPPVEAEEFSAAFMTMVACETRAAVEWVSRTAGRPLSLKYFEPVTQGLALLGEAFTGGEYAAALDYLMSAARRVGRFFEGFDVLLTPTLPEPPPRIGFLQPTAFEAMVVRLAGRLRAGGLLRAMSIAERMSTTTFDFVAYTPVFNVTGQPAMSVPLWQTAEGLPVGMHFAGRFGDEATLFRLAGQLERATPWKDRTPPLLAAGRAEQALPADSGSR